MRHRFLTTIIQTSLVLSLISLVGCCFFKKSTFKPEPPQLPYKKTATKDCDAAAMPGKFKKFGVTVINIGQDYLISIPSSVLFAQDSPRVLWKSYRILNGVVCYLKQFREITINVTGFSSRCVSVKRERALTLARARAVGDYLWSQGVDSRFIFTQGLGSDKPIENCGKYNDKAGNSRIEITFRNAVA